MHRGGARDGNVETVAVSDQKYWHKRFAGNVDICTVGCRDRSAAQNEKEYKAAAELFKSCVASDLPKRSSVLDLGYGLGHYAKLCHVLGFTDYVGIDFAAPPGPPLGPSYVYRQGDIGQRFDLGRKFDLVLAIDVLFHVTDSTRFETALDNIRRHASGVMYVTGIPKDRRIAAHVVHRDVDRFQRLGDLIAIAPWRDTSIMRFRSSLKR